MVVGWAGVDGKWLDNGGGRVVGQAGPAVPSSNHIPYLQNLQKHKHSFISIRFLFRISRHGRRPHSGARMLTLHGTKGWSKPISVNKASMAGGRRSISLVQGVRYLFPIQIATCLCICVSVLCLGISKG